MMRVYIDFENEEKYLNQCKIWEGFKEKFYNFVSALKTENGIIQYVDCNSLSELYSLLNDVFSLFDNYNIEPDNGNIFITTH